MLKHKTYTFLPQVSTESQNGKVRFVKIDEIINLVAAPTGKPVVKGDIKVLGGIN